MLINKLGVTSLGLTVVAAVISIFSAFAMAAAHRSAQHSNVSLAKTQLSAFADALEVILADTGTYPGTLYDVKQPFAPPGVSRENWHGPYVHKLPLRDPWGKAYHYETIKGGSGNSDVAGYILRTDGRDGVSGGKGLDEDIIINVML